MTCYNYVGKGPYKYPLQWFLHKALRFYPLVSMLGRGTCINCCLPVLGYWEWIARSEPRTIKKFTCSKKPELFSNPREHLAQERSWVVKVALKKEGYQSSLKNLELPVKPLKALPQGILDLGKLPKDIFFIFLHL